MNEIVMKQINAFPDYFVSEEGKVFSTRVNRELSPIRDWYGPTPYFYVCLYNGTEKKKYAIHKLVAEHFLPPKPFEEAVIRHLNCDSLDNKAENLVWGSKSEDRMDSVRIGNIPTGSQHRNAKLTDGQVEEIRSSIEPLRVFSERFGVHISTVHRARVQKTYPISR